MNREDIIRMAREQGLPETEVEGVFRVNTDDLGRFAALVEERHHTNNKARWYQKGVESEREACIRAVEQIGQHGIITQCVNAIRARGNA